jgi:foldase protein PrsA
MVARQRGRKVVGVLVTLAAVAGLGYEAAWAQAPFRSSRSAASKSARKKAQEAAPAPAEPAEAPTMVLKAIPVNPSDPIALVNNEPITRQQLADECVARKGEEILETLIARRLIEQALRARKLDVTPAEVDQEIDNVAQRMAGIGREAWLRTLDKERGISPAQYAHDIIYPALALRKLSASRVQVTDKDVRDAFEAQYGDKIRCRLIMTDTLPKAREIWELLRKNPGGFEKLAQERSMDSGSRSLGGLLAEPITRHAYPQTVSDAAFRQLVDGDPQDKDPSHKPKNGDFTGPIQVAEATWVILRREGVIPAQPVSLKDPNVRKQAHDMIYEVKLKEAMGEFFAELMKASAIENKMTGKVKLANEELHPDHQVDREVKLMGGQGQPAGAQAGGAAGSAGAAGLKVPAPVGAPSEDVLSKQAEALKKSAVPK